MDLNTLFDKAHKSAPKNKTYTTQLFAFEEFMEDNCYDIDALKNESEQIRDGYLSSQYDEYNYKQAVNVFNRITSILSPNNDNKLINKKLYNKFNHFSNSINFHTPNHNNKSHNNTVIDKYIPFEYKTLKPFERVCINNNIPLSEYLVTNYHQSGLPINEYIAENELFNQLRVKYDLLPTNNNISHKYDLMTNYLNEYEKLIHKPLHLMSKNNNKYTDNITIIINYMIEINNGIHKILSEKASYPIQLDVYFVAPNTHTDLNLHSLNGLRRDEIKSDSYSRKNGAVDGIADIYHLLRRAANAINMRNNQRFTMLIVRNKTSDTSLDTIYIYNSTNMNAPSHISDNSELTYLLNSKRTPIVDGLYTNSNGILGLTHHLHGINCSKMYLSYDNYKSRTFKNDFLPNLQLIMNNENISNNKRIDFMNSFKDFKDENYHKIGEYFFSNIRAYECFEPAWNKQNCRAMGNVYIPKQNTNDLMYYIREQFDTPEKLYYKMDYTIGMQIVDKQTVYYRFKNKNGKNICIINTELHHKENGEILYAIIVENTYKSKQKWKIIDYKHISEAFMTRKQLIDTYNIFICDLPKGSKIKHNNFIQMTNKIKVSKQLIRNTHWSHIRIVQSKQNIDASNNSKDNTYISERRFKQLALNSLNSNKNKLISIAQFKFRKNKYHIEKLLPVYIPEHNKWIAVSFWYNQNNNQPGKTQVSGVCLDLIDIKNKANLIQEINSDSWLNQNHNLTFNNLIIGSNKSNKKMNNKQMKSTKTNFNGKSHFNKPSQLNSKPMPYVPSKVQPQPQAPTPMPYIPSKVGPQSQPQPQSYSPPSPPMNQSIIQQQMSPAISPQSMSNIPQIILNTTPLQSVPLLVSNSSIGSVGSIPSLCSMPMQSIPSIQTFQYQTVNTVNVPNSLPNMQQLQQNAQYFANFLRPNFLINTNYNTNTNANYNTQLNQNGYY